MRARLICRGGPLRGEYEVTDETVLGRHPGNGLVLTDDLLSGRHARIAYDPGRDRFVLEDLGSLNGTALDGEPVVEPEPLDHLNVITLARAHDFIFQDLSLCAARAAAPAPSAATAESGLTASAAGMAGPLTDRTQQEPLPPAVPAGVLSPTGPPASAEGGPSPPGKTSGTILEQAPPNLPQILVAAGKVDAETVAAAEGRGDDADGEGLDFDGGATLGPGEDLGPGKDSRVLFGGPARDDSREGTVLENAPPGLPAMLARQASDLADREAMADLVEDILAEDGAIVLVLNYPDGQVERVALREGENLVGRHPSAQIRPASLEISRRHAVLEVDGDRVTVRDLGSRNQTFVDGESAETAIVTGAGSKLRFGALRGRLERGKDAR
ncbi:MAG: FHA domain-containing protein [Acidobacteriota bacterium]